MTINKLANALRTATLPLAVVAASLSLTPSAGAATVISLTDGIGDPSKISISPGDNFMVTFRLSATVEQLTGTTYSLLAPGPAAGKFRIATRDIVGTLFTFLQADNVSNTLLTDVVTVDLGASVDNLAVPAQPGNHFLADYTIASDPTLAPGIYFLQVGSNSIALDTLGNSIPLSTSSYQVTVVPEPGTAALALGGLGVLSATMRRRRKPSTV